MSTRHAIAVDFGRRQFRAVWIGGGRTRGGLKVRRMVAEEVPASVNADDPQALGAWAGERLKTAGFPRGRAVIVIGREHVVMKRLCLPTTESAELPDMVRLAMARELPFDLPSAALDFLPLHANDTSTTVLAVATAQSIIDQQVAIARAAGLSVGRIALRTLGAAALLDASRDASWALSLLEPDGSDDAPCTLLIDVRRENLELAVLHRGAIDFSRAAEVPEPQDELAIAEAIVTETRRTWMSYQSAALSAETRRGLPEAQAAEAAASSMKVADASGAGRARVREALLMGEQRVCEYAAKPVSQLLGARTRVLEANGSVESAGHEVDHVWPLIGALLEERQQAATIDFAHPRRAPDLGARARQRRMIAAGIALVAILGAWTLARQQLNRLNAQSVELTRTQRDQLPDYARYWRDRYKLEHLKKWESASVDWLQHASYLTTIAPPPDRLVLNGWTGTLKFGGVAFDRKTGKWSADATVTISIDGEARDRDTADSFRAALVQSSMYNTTTPGADARAGRRMPFAFTYTLRTRNGVVPPASPGPDARVVKANGGKP